MDKVADESREEERLLDQVVIEQLILRLEPKERQLIHLRYFEGKTQSRVADDMGMTQVQVSRMEKKVLHKMRLLL